MLSEVQVVCDEQPGTCPGTSRYDDWYEAIYIDGLLATEEPRGFSGGDLSALLSPGHGLRMLPPRKFSLARVLEATGHAGVPATLAELDGLGVWVDE